MRRSPRRARRQSSNRCRDVPSGRCAAARRATHCRRRCRAPCAAAAGACRRTTAAARADLVVRRFLDDAERVRLRMRDHLRGGLDRRDGNACRLQARLPRRAVVRREPLADQAVDLRTIAQACRIGRKALVARPFGRSSAAHSGEQRVVRGADDQIAVGRRIRAMRDDERAPIRAGRRYRRPRCSSRLPRSSSRSPFPAASR